ncbi:hypothetical protein EDB89DRAFT_1823550, partial [Lactarius sanguifluus]
GRTKELPSVHLEHVHRMVDSPGNISSSDNKCSSVLLRNLVKPEDDLNDPTSDDAFHILVHIRAEELVKVYNLPIFNTMFEFIKPLTFIS